MSKKLATTVSLEALTSITGASGEIDKGPDDKTIGVLTLETGAGEVSITVAQFDAIYKGMVNCWPAVKPLKDKVITAQREETKAAKEAEREATKAAKKAEKEAAKKARDEEAAKKKAEKEAKAKADKEAKEKAEKEAAAKKAKEDKEKAKKAADEKAKKDKAAGATK